MRPKPSNLLNTILWVGFLVGLLDISSAFIQTKITFPDRNPFELVLRYIARAVFGKERAATESSMLFFGALFHFIIAYCFTIAFFLIYPHILFLSTRRLLTGVLYGIIIWAVMNLIVVPQTHIGQRPFVLKNAAIAAGILIVAIGIPLSYFAYRFYYRRKAPPTRQSA
jgi:uncharacterized membrane protein YagU involved in acid resistance